MGKCMICKKEAKLFDGMCQKCLGEGANISLLNSISNKDDAMVKMIDDRVAQGKIVRII